MWIQCCLLLLLVERATSQKTEIDVRDSCEFMDANKVYPCLGKKCEISLNVHLNQSLHESEEFSGFLELEEAELSLTDCFSLKFFGMGTNQNVVFLRIPVYGEQIFLNSPLPEDSYVYIPTSALLPGQKVQKAADLKSIIYNSALNSELDPTGHGIVITKAQKSNGFSFILRQPFDISGIASLAALPKSDSSCPSNEQVYYRNCFAIKLSAQGSHKTAFFTEFTGNYVLWYSIIVTLAYLAWGVFLDDDSQLRPSDQYDLGYIHQLYSVWVFGNKLQPKTQRLNLVFLTVLSQMLGCCLIQKGLEGHTYTERTCFSVLISLPFSWWVQRIFSICLVSQNSASRAMIEQLGRADTYEDKVEALNTHSNKLLKYGHVFYGATLLFSVWAMVLSVMVTYSFKAQQSDELMAAIGLSFLLEVSLVDLIRILVAHATRFRGYVLSRMYYVDYGLQADYLDCDDLR